MFCLKSRWCHIKSMELFLTSINMLSPVLFEIIWNTVRLHHLRVYQSKTLSGAPLYFSKFSKFTFWYKRQFVTTSFALFSILTKSRRNWISLLNCESILAMMAARSLNVIGIFTFSSFLNFLWFLSSVIPYKGMICHTLEPSRDLLINVFEVSTTVLIKPDGRSQTAKLPYFFK